MCSKYKSTYSFIRNFCNRTPYVKFDNAHSVKHRGGKYVPKPTTYDHWHRTEKDLGRPYRFTTAVQLLEDFWREVKRVMTEKSIPNDL